MKSILQLFLASALISAAPAAVTFTFDTTTQGFGNVGWNAAGGSTSWSANNGGSLALNFLTAGWTNPVAVLGLTSTPELTTEFNNARLFGGTLTFDYIVSQANVVGYSSATPPGWFELVATGNSDNAPASGGGWDQNVLGGAVGYYGGIPAGPTTKSVSLGLSGGAPVENNNALSFGPGSPWGEIMFGMNSQGASFTSAVVYLDNVTFTANPAPEPTAAGLGLLALGSLVVRRRR